MVQDMYEDSDIVIFRDRVEESLGMWRYGLMRSESQQKHHVCK